MPKGGTSESLEERLARLLTRESALLAGPETITVAGVDEAGRGPMAGPVVCAAAQHGRDFPPEKDLPWLRLIYDSKQLTERQREEVYAHLMEPDCPLKVSIAQASHEEIDSTDILKATHRAMLSAVQGLPQRPDFVLVDGTSIPNLNILQERIVKGDSLCLCIAAASIAAKVTRDHIMLELDRLYPEYGFAQHKGYGTKAHLEAIRKYGRSPVHRRTFYVAGLDPQPDRQTKARETRRVNHRKGAGEKGLPDSPAQLSLFEE